MKGKGVFRAIWHERRLLFYRKPKGDREWKRKKYRIISDVRCLTTEL